MRARSSLTAARRPRARGDRPRRDRLEEAPRLEDVGQRHVARLEHERRGARRHPLVGLVHDDAAAHAAHDGDEALGLEDPQRLAQRRARHAEPLDEVGLVAERVAFRQLAGDDQRAQLVGDLLRLLARVGSFAWLRPSRHPRRRTPCALS